MKLKCNVCHESPTVEIDAPPKSTHDLVCCPSCDKQLAYSTEGNRSNKLVWTAIDTEYSESLGKSPVEIVAN